MHFVKDSTGWAAGHNGIILHTKNGGDTWNRQITNVFEHLADVHFINREEGWAVGGSRVRNNVFILYTSDGGETWVHQGSDVEERILDVHFLNDSTGWIAGTNGFIAQTKNSGSDWNTKQSGTNWDLRGVAFINDVTGWTSSTFGIVSNTMDGGNSWNNYDFSTPSFDTHGMDFNNEGIVWFAAGGINRFGEEYGVIIEYNPGDSTNVEIKGPDSLCASDSAIYETDFNPDYSYDWSVSNGDILKEKKDSIVVRWHREGPGKVTLEKKDTSAVISAIHSDSLEITLLNNPEPTISGPSTIKANEEAQSFKTPLEEGHKYHWHSENGEIIDGQNSHEASIAYQCDAIGTHEITLTQTDTASGCEATARAELTIEPLPEPEIEGPQEVCENISPHSYSVEANEDYAYNWAISGGTIISGRGSPEVEVE